MNKTDKSIISKRLKACIDEKNMSYGVLSEMTNIPKSAIHRYTTGATVKIPIERVESIAKALGISAAYLMGWSDDPSPFTSLRFPSPTVTENVVTFPVIGEVAAGFDRIALEDWDGDTVEIPASYLHGRPSSDFFVLTVHGTSMYPLYLEGDRVLVKKVSTMDYSGQIGVVIYDDENGTVKKVEYKDGEDWIRLVPINPEYPPRLIAGVDLEQCHIIGIPTLLIRELEE